MEVQDGRIRWERLDSGKSRRRRRIMVVQKLIVDLLQNVHIVNFLTKKLIRNCLN